MDEKNKRIREGVRRKRPPPPVAPRATTKAERALDQIGRAMDAPADPRVVEASGRRLYQRMLALLRDLEANYNPRHSGQREVARRLVRLIARWEDRC